MSNFRFEISTTRGGYDDSNMLPAGNIVTVELFQKRWDWHVWELIKPVVKRVKIVRTFNSVDEYIEYTQRRYGAYMFDGHFNVMYGNASDDSREEQRWSCFVPWSAARFIRTSHYDRDGTRILLTHWDRKRPGKSGFKDWQQQRDEVDALDNITVFAFADYDGQEILATCRVEEREWRLGTGVFRWLFFFRRPRIEKSLSLEFNEEVGPGKSSWKGGIVGHGASMQPGESVRHAWARYCDKYHLTPLDRSPLEICEMKTASDRAKAARRAAAARSQPDAMVAKPNV